MERNTSSGQIYKHMNKLITEEGGIEDSELTFSSVRQKSSNIGVVSRLKTSI